MNQFAPRAPNAYSYEPYYSRLEPTTIIGGSLLYFADDDTVLDFPIAVFRFDDDMVIP